MPTTDGGMLRYDIEDPADVQVLVNRGWAWKSGPKTLQAIVRLIVDGEVTRKPETETPEVTAYLDKLAPIKPPYTPLEPGQVLPDPEEALSIPSDSSAPMVDPGDGSLL